MFHRRNGVRFIVEVNRHLDLNRRLSVVSIQGRTAKSGLRCSLICLAKCASRTDGVYLWQYSSSTVLENPMWSSSWFHYRGCCVQECVVYCGRIEEIERTCGNVDRTLSLSSCTSTRPVISLVQVTYSSVACKYWSASKKENNWDEPHVNILYLRIRPFILIVKYIIIWVQ